MSSDLSADKDEVTEKRNLSILTRRRRFGLAFLFGGSTLSHFKANKKPIF